MPGGQLVLCECKWRPAKKGETKARLCYSDLEKHQVSNLNIARNLGAVPLLVWHSGSHAFALPWPILRPRASIDEATAAKYEIVARSDLLAYAVRCKSECDTPTQSQL